MKITGTIYKMATKLNNFNAISNVEYFLPIGDKQVNMNNQIGSYVHFIFLKEIYCNPVDKNNFSKKKLQKIFYFHGIFYLKDVIDFQLFRYSKNTKKLIELKEYFEKLEKPSFPIKAKIVMEKYNIKEGKELGQKLKYLENLWVENSFKITDKEVDKVFLS